MIIGHQPLVDDGELDRARGLREGRLGGARVADCGLEGEIARPVGPDARRARLRARPRRRSHAAAAASRPRSPRRRPSPAPAYRRPRRRSASPTWRTSSRGQDRIERNRDVHVGQHAGRRQRPELGNLGGGEHQAHARHRAHAVEIADAEAGMRVRRAQHHRVQRRRRARRRPRSAPARAAARRLPCA